MLAETYYVGYRSNPPDEASRNAVLKVLHDNNIDTTNLVDWSADNCPQPETTTTEAITA
jgi:TusA-related sulfurtransferase